jgi:hypothetical protein
MMNRAHSYGVGDEEKSCIINGHDFMNDDTPRLKGGFGAGANPPRINNLMQFMFTHACTLSLID